MIDTAQAKMLLAANESDLKRAEKMLSFVGFEDVYHQLLELQKIASALRTPDLLAEVLPSLLFALSDTADPDRSLRNLHRYFNAVDDRDAAVRYFVENPRAVEILTRIFVGSQFLTEILLRNPGYLERLTQYKRLAEFKSREDFVEAAEAGLSQPDSLEELKRQLRTFQQWEILRIAACDSFGLMDLKTVTLQLSLLADAIVQLALREVLRIQKMEAPDFTVIAFGKLGGLELNYSSDIDLVFLCEESPDRYAGVGQKLIQVLSDLTANGFLYRVDMRLRPWGSSGPLVTTTDAYSSYYSKQAQLWERQAILKARAIAGNILLGEKLLKRVRKDAFDVDAETVRTSIVRMKDQIEEKAGKQAHAGHGVKGGPGGIRDIEFLVQYLQFVHGKQIPQIRRVGTLESLIYLSDANLIHAQEFRTLSNAYVVLRTIEHSLQLMHNQPEYFLPESDRELAYLARRLDFPNVELFLELYSKQTHAVKEIFDYQVRQIERVRLSENAETYASNGPLPTVAGMGNLERLREQLTSSKLAVLAQQAIGKGEYELSVIGEDRIGAFSIFCGLLLIYGFDVVSGTAETNSLPDESRNLYLNRFRVKVTPGAIIEREDGLWGRFEQELNELLGTSVSGNVLEAQNKLVQRLASNIESQPEQSEPLLPVEITIEQDSDSELTELHIQGENVSGFLFELTNAISVNGYSIKRMTVESDGLHAKDILWIEDPHRNSVLDEAERTRLKTTIVLIKHFIHLLPHAPNPEKALLHFRELLKNLFEQADWIDQIQRLQQPEVLNAVARLLGFSDFLWEDFLRLQHQNLFPVVTDLSGMQLPRWREELLDEIHEKLKEANGENAREILNEFKDREMMRVDMRHIMELQKQFGSFSRELTAVAEVVTEVALELALKQLTVKYGMPQSSHGDESRITVCALGKFGGFELGYASDIELMFVYEEEGHTSGKKRISNAEFFQRVVETFKKTIYTREKRIFDIDLRLRPYGKAGSLAVSRDAFRQYFKMDGPAWPYERQALVKLRPVAGDRDFGEEILGLRDELIYTGVRFDIAAMRAIREKQIRQLVQPGTFHAKLSPGGLVDCEYFVQGLQMTFGHLSNEIRAQNTRLAMKGLENHGILSHEQRVKLRDAYRFLRRLIDGMRMVRGDASDLTIPHHETEQFEFLAKRLGVQRDNLHQEIERQTCNVIEFVSQFDQLIASNTEQSN